MIWIYLEADDDPEQQHFVAGTAGAEVSNIQFLPLLFAGNGKAFGVQVCGCAPTQIATPLTDLPMLADLFVRAYNGFPQAWETLDAWQDREAYLSPSDPAEARQLVERHLRKVLAVILLSAGGR